MDGQPEAPRELTEEEKKKMMAGQFNYLLLMTLSLTAFILGQNASWTCNFATRKVNFFDENTVESTCAQGDLTFTEASVCGTFLGDHGIGFYHWMGVVPVDTKVCLSWTQFVPKTGYVTPEFDSAFGAAEVFAVMANVFGAFGWFSTIMATCCPVSQERIAGLSCYFSLACICQCFTFLIYSSDICQEGWYGQYFPQLDLDNAVESVECSLGSGAKMSITAAVLYAVCSFLAPMSTAPQPVRLGGYGRAPAEEPQAQAQQPAATEP